MMVRPLAAVCALYAPLACAVSPALPMEFVVTNPFETPLAVDNFVACIGKDKLSKPEIARLNRLEELRYVETLAPKPLPEGSKVACPAYKTKPPVFQSTRSTLLLVPDLEQSSIRATFPPDVSKCEYTYLVRGLVPIVESPNAVRYEASVYVKNRVCGTFLWWDYATDVSMIRARVYFKVVTKEDLSLDITNFDVKVDEVSNFGIEIPGIEDLEKDAIRKRLEEQAPNYVAQKLDASHRVGDDSITGFALGLARTAASLRRGLKEAIQRIQNVDENFQQAAVGSGFQQYPTSGQVSFRFLDVSYYQACAEEIQQIDRPGLKKFFDDLKKPKESEYTVRNGDNLWRIARSTLGDGRAYLYLAAKNDVGKRLHLKPGTTLQLFNSVDVCKDSQQGSVVLPGDSWWALTNARTERKNWTPVSGQRRLVYPYELIGNKKKDPAPSGPTR